MTAWGVAPARGRFRICGVCGARLAFAEVGRAGATPEAERRLLDAIQQHLTASASCRDASTFSGGVIAACRCERPLTLPREEGLVCARCEGLIAPEVGAALKSAPGRRRSTRGSR